jgi:predicted ATPase/class 3 adenylate cyclase
MQPVLTLHFGPFHLAGTDDSLWCGPQRCRLKAKAVAVLRYLVQHPGHLVRKADLLAAIWPDVHVSEWVLTTCICEIRQVLGDVASDPRYIATVHRQGYRFIAPVTVAAAPPPLPSLAASPVPALPQATPPPAMLTEEYKLVTLLCGAVRAAPALAARLGPERWYRWLQAMVGLAQDVLHHYDGTLLPPTSEGFTAVFGAPVAQEDHARRAVLAALELRQRLRDTPILHTPLVGKGLTLSMGLHSGLVVVGCLGNDSQRISTAVGEPFYVATRLQQQATPGAILLSAATYALVHTEVGAVACGTCDIEGLSPSAPLYAVQALLRRHAGVVGRSPRVLSPFVGRERELALLHDRLEAVRTGAGQVVSLVGPPGMGKTRLLTEFRGHLPRDQVTWYLGQCLMYGQGTPYLLVRDIIQQVCACAEGDPLETHAAAVRRRLTTLGEVTEEDIALVHQLLDVPVAPHLLERRSPETWQARTFALLAHLLRHEAQRQPLVLTVENTHWIDPTSEAWLAFLVERLAGTALLLLVTYRPGYQPPWGAHAVVTQLALPPLRAQESQAIMAAVPGTAQLSAARRQQIVAHGAGNPFFIEELAWHTVEYGLSATPVPETVHAVLAARIDRLLPEDKRLLQTAAVIGTEVTWLLLQAIADMSDDALSRSLAHLQAAEFLYETSPFPERAYTFKHALTHEVAYGSLLQGQRCALHGRIVEVLEALYPAQRAEPVERLAHHALRGEVWEKALTYCRQAGEKAMVRSAHREAVGYFEQVLSALAHLPETRDTREQAIDLRLVLRSALLANGDSQRALTCMHEAETLAMAFDDPRRLGRVSRWLTRQFHFRRAYDQAIAVAQRALALALSSGDAVLHALTNQSLGPVYLMQGDYRRAIDCFEQSMAFLDGERRRERFGENVLPAAFSSAYLAWCHAELGTFAEGSALAEEGLRIAEAVNHPVSLIVASWGVGLLALRQGRLARVLLLLERFLSISQEVDLWAYLPFIAMTLGAAYTLSGRVADAVPLLTQAMERATAMERADFQTFCRLPLGEAELLAGRIEEAHTLAEQALTLARERQEHGHQAYALRLLGEIAARHDSPERTQAEVHYRQALALAEALGMCPLQAHCHFGLGSLYCQMGWQEQARAELETAINLYRTMEMTFWLPQTEALLAQLGAGKRPAGVGVP